MKICFLMISRQRLPPKTAMVKIPGPIITFHMRKKYLHFLVNFFPHILQALKASHYCPKREL